MNTHGAIRRFTTTAALFGGLVMAPLGANAMIAHYADVVESSTAYYEAQANGSHVYAGRAGYVSIDKRIARGNSKTRVAYKPKGEVFLPRVGYVKINS